MHWGLHAVSGADRRSHFCNCDISHIQAAVLTRVLDSCHNTHLGAVHIQLWRSYTTSYTLEIAFVELGWGEGRKVPERRSVMIVLNASGKHRGSNMKFMFARLVLLATKPSLHLGYWPHIFNAFIKDLNSPFSSNDKNDWGCNKCLYALFVILSRSAHLSTSHAEITIQPKFL